MNSQTQGAYTNEMDPTQTSTPPAGQLYSTTETTTTTHTSRTPHHSTGTAAGPMGTSGGAVGGEKSGRGLLDKVVHGAKSGTTMIHGMGEAGRGAWNEKIDRMAGDVSIRVFIKTQDRKMERLRMDANGLVTELRC